MPLPKEPNSRELEAAIKAFKDWRINREKKCRIPDRLWKIAAKLSPQYPTSRICRNLGLNWGDFKKKLAQLSLSSNPPAKCPASPSFIELKLEEQKSLIPFGHSPRCTVELTRPDGTIMKIFASNSNDTDTPLNLNLLELCEIFLEKEKRNGR